MERVECGCGVVLNQVTVEPGAGRREGEREDRVNVLLVLSEYICIAFRDAVLTFVTHTHATQMAI